MSDTCLCRRPGRVLLGTLLSLLPLTSASAQSTNAVPASTETPAVATTTTPGRTEPAPLSSLRVRAEFRERMEAVDSAAFVSDRDDVFWLSRLRFDVSFLPTPWLGVHTQLQDARVAKKDVGSGGAPFSAPIDIRLAHVDLGAANARLSARVGRQELAFGEQRLVGHVSWLNAARSFDAARVTARARGVRLDAFAGSVVRIATNDWDRSGRGSRFHGVHATLTTLVPDTTIEPYFFWRGERDQRVETGGAATLRLGTTGVRIAGVLPAGIDYGLETVVQRGSVGTDSAAAWAQHARLRMPAARWLRLAGEYNYATGDRTPTDGRRGTFDPLYPTPHDKYGLADQIGWRNIHHLRAAVDVTAVTRLPITAAYHSWWLASAGDGLYLPSGALFARMPGGAAHRHVGHEFDVQASRAITPQFQLAGGYAFIRPGAVLRATTPGASFHSTFLMLTYVFSADR